MRGCGWLVAGVLLVCGSAQARHFFVDTVQDTPDVDPGDGQCADAGQRCSLRAAIMQANAMPAHLDYVVHLRPGDFVLSIPGGDEDASQTGDLDAHRRLTILGAGTSLTRIDGAALDRVLDVRPGAHLRLRQLTVDNGRLLDSGSEAGVGIRVAPTSTLRLDDVVISGHRSRGVSGGIAIDSQGCVRGRRVRVVDNRDTEEMAATASAAIHVHGAAGGTACLELDDSEISDNLADQGGAIVSVSGSVVLRRVLISGNVARAAGALQLLGEAHARLESTTVSGNRGDPGAILVNDDSRLDVMAGTITDNGPRDGESAGVGGLRKVQGSAALAFLTNTILAGNGPGQIADDCVGVASLGGGNLFGDCTQLTALPNDGIGVELDLAPLADHGGFTRSHLPSAEAIDGGWNGACPATDQRGVPRPFDRNRNGVAICDVGAVELPCESATFVVDTFVDTVDVQPGDGHCADAEQRCSLRAAIQEANALPGVDIIELPAGDFVLAIAGAHDDVSTTGDLDITDDLILRGAGEDVTRIDGGALDRVIDVHASAGEARYVSLRRLTLRNGSFVQQSGVWNDGGAGLRVASGARVDIEDVILRGHHIPTAIGRGIAIALSGRVTGRRVRILENQSENGMAPIMVGANRGDGPCELNADGEPDAFLALTDCEISGNAADQAGAIYGSCGRTELRRCLVNDNQAGNVGVMLLNVDAPARLENVTLSGNRGGSVGAITNDGFSRLDIYNSTLTGNGGIPGWALPGNGALQDVHGGPGMTFLANTILAGNGPSHEPWGADDCNKGVSLGGNIIGDAEGCAKFAPHASDQLGVIPALAPLAGYGGFSHVHRPVSGSAAIDRGLDVVCMASDQRGVLRPQDGDGDGNATCDIGAVEVEGDRLFEDGFDIGTSPFR